MRTAQLFFVSSLFLTLFAIQGCKGSSGNSGKIKVKEDFYIKIEHTGCRGTCPVYWMSCDANGNAKFYGHYAVEMMGNFTKELPKSTVKELASAVEEFNYWAFDKEYGGGVADLPSVKTEVKHQGKHQKVNDIRQAPKELKEFEQRVEDLIGKEGWQSVD